VTVPERYIAHPRLLAAHAAATRALRAGESLATGVPTAREVAAALGTTAAAALEMCRAAGLALADEPSERDVVRARRSWA
jgi:hypothetical protein